MEIEIKLIKAALGEWFDLPTKVKISKQSLEILYKNFWHIAAFAHIVGLLVSSLLLLIFIYRGVVLSQPKHDRGAQLLDAGTYRSKLKRDCAFFIQQIPIIKDALCRHFLFLGTTGTGKTVLLKEFLKKSMTFEPQMFCLDIDGSFKQLFEGKEHIDLSRPLNWEFFKDFKAEFDFEAAAAALIPQTQSDKFWIDSARTVFVSLCLVVTKFPSPSLKSLYELCCHHSPKEVARYLSGTPAAALAGNNGPDDKTFQSVLATLSTYASKLRYCIAPEAEPFSLNSLFEDKKSCLFTISQSNIEAFRPLLTLWFESVIRLILSQKETNDWKPRYFLVLDELASLNAMPSLPLLATRGRKYGASIFIGLQDVHQLEKLYYHEAEALHANLSTKFFLRQGTYKNAVWAAEIIGYAQNTEQRQSTSFGANEYRDAVSVSSHDQKDFVLLPTELLALENRVAIVRQLHHDPVKIIF
jgi:hypothetical protein